MSRMAALISQRIWRGRDQKLQEAKALLEERNTELQATKDELAAEKAAAAKAAPAKAAEHEAAVAAKESECA